MSSPYIFQKDNIWYCMLPNRCYKEIPYTDWIKDINWSVVYYKVYQSLIQEDITYQQIKDWPIDKILKVAADIEL